jgi:predicted transcriptional regulator
MKYIGVFILFIALFFSNDIYGKGKVVSDTLQVNGVCDMCKERIENAALIRGVKKATYNKHKHQLIVIYNPEKTSVEVILKSVAEAGHDNEMFKAADEVYNRLPRCCAYRSSEAHVH